jgi:hypothetical protein
MTLRKIEEKLNTMGRESLTAGELAVYDASLDYETSSRAARIAAIDRDTRSLGALIDSLPAAGR